MKILHSADWHLGAKNLKLPSAKQQLLKAEIMENVHNLFAMASEEDYDVVVIAGDLFHSKNITQKLLSSFLNAVENFSKPVLYIEGNHDENFVFTKELPENFIVLNKENPKFDIYNYVFYSEYCDNFQLNQSKTNILILHGNIENTRDNDYVNINNFLEYPFDYIALGHVHSYKKYKKGERIFAYSGSLFSNGFDECGDKVFLEVVIENKRLEKIEFKPFSQRRYMLCECDITGAYNNSDIVEKVKESLKQNGVKTSDLVRVVLKGQIDEDATKTLGYIENMLDGYFYVELIDNSRIKVDMEKIKKEKLSFKYEFISLVESSDLNESDKSKICEIGLEALKGEDLPL